MEDTKKTRKSDITQQKAFHPENGRSGNGSPSQRKPIKADSPEFDQWVYDKLPKVLQELTREIEDKRSRDVFLLSSITAVASVLPNINIKMAGKTYHPLMYTMVVAPSTSGKGVAPKAKKLVEPVDKYLKEQRLGLDTSRVASSGGNANRRTGKRLFIPGNISARALLDAVGRNDGAGLLFETEIDTLIIINGSEWGNFSDIIRKGFDHEDISFARKDEDSELPRPFFSIFLAGTDNQFVRFVKDPEDGHFARYLFYTFEANPEWISQKPTEKDAKLDRLVEQAQGEIFDLYKSLSHRKQPLEFVMPNGLWDLHTEHFELITSELKDQDAPQHIHSLTKRAGVRAVRMACIFALLDYCGNASKLEDKNRLQAKKQNVEAAIQIATDAISHGWVLAINLNNPSEASMKRNPTKQKWYNALEDSFETQEAEDMAVKFGFTDRSARNWLKDKGLFTKMGHGKYQKRQ